MFPDTISTEMEGLQGGGEYVGARGEPRLRGAHQDLRRQQEREREGGTNLTF